MSAEALSEDALHDVAYREHGLDPMLVAEQAVDDGIITGYDEGAERYNLFGTVAEFRVYVERLAGRWS